MVWKAISSITPMIWLICCDDFSMPPMASTALRTTSPLFSASSLVLATTPRACVAPSAAFLTVAVISSSAAAVSSRLEACCSVRRERSLEAVEISCVPESIASALACTPCTACSSCSMAAVEVRLQLLVGLRHVVGHAIGEVLGRELGQAGADRVGDHRPLLGLGLGLSLETGLLGGIDIDGDRKVHVEQDGLDQRRERLARLLCPVLRGALPSSPWARSRTRST